MWAQCWQIFSFFNGSQKSACLCEMSRFSNVGSISYFKCCADQTKCLLAASLQPLCCIRRYCSATNWNVKKGSGSKNGGQSSEEERKHGLTIGGPAMWAPHSLSFHCQWYRNISTFPSEVHGISHGWLEGPKYWVQILYKMPWKRWPSLNTPYLK